MIEKLVGCHDEPFGDAADIPLYLLAEQLRGSIKVILQGDGGDEMFGGYRRYVVLSRERFWRSMSRLARPFISWLPPSPPARLAAGSFRPAPTSRPAPAGPGAPAPVPAGALPLPADNGDHVPEVCPRDGEVSPDRPRFQSR